MDDAIFALSKQKRSGMYAGPFLCYIKLRLHHFDWATK